MKHAVLIAALAIFALAACNSKKSDDKAAAVVPATSEKAAPPIAPTTPFPTGHPNISAGSSGDSASGMPTAEQTQQATVVSSIDVPDFTYIEVKDGDQTRWLASTTLGVKKGDVIEFVEDSTMDEFTSKTLNRTFSSLTFIRNASVVNKE